MCGLQGLRITVIDPTTPIGQFIKVPELPDNRISGWNGLRQGNAALNETKGSHDGPPFL